MHVSQSGIGAAEIFQEQNESKSNIGITALIRIRMLIHRVWLIKKSILFCIMSSVKYMINLIIYIFLYCVQFSPHISRNMGIY